MATYDILLKDGTIIDGTGKPRFKGDIGISEGLIKDIGTPSLAGAEAGKVISAFGKFVAPGFIDITSHADKNWSLFNNPEQDYLLTQGVTTILAGNCGSSLAPLPSREAVDSLRKWSQGSDSNINWLTIGELIEELSRHKLGVNVATLIGHGTIRRGLTKGASRALSNEELQQLIELIEGGITDGAFGLSAGLIYSHEAVANSIELAAMAKAVARMNGVYKPHIRHEGENLVPAVSETIEIGRQSGATIVISHFKAIGRKSWHYFKKALDIIERASQNGQKINFDISPYRRTGSFMYLLLPNWAREGGFSQMLRRVSDPQSRADIIKEIKKQTLHYDRYIIATSTTHNVNGKTIAEVAERTASSPEDTMNNLLLANQGRVTVFGRSLSSKNILTGIAHPLGIIASDGNGVSAELSKTGKLVHPRSTGAFPHFIHKFIKEKQIVSWEDGIRKVTSLPAEAMGFKNRGRIEKKFFADIVVFDPEKFRDNSTYHNPYIHSTGVETLLLSGKAAIEQGALTETRNGQVLKKS